MNNYTDDVKKCLENAENLSKFTGCLLESIHLLVGLTEDQTYLSAKILSKMGFNYLIAKSFLIKTTFIPENNTTIISPVARSILNYAEKIAKNNNRTVDTQHILLSITYHKNCVASKILNRFNINYETISQIIEGIDINSNIKINQEKIDSSFSHNTQKNLESIEKFGINLNKKAAENKLNPVLCRENEINRLIRIISRKNKNNAIIVGESGVGKTALVEGLAILIEKNSVPDNLKNKIIFSLNVNNIISGTKYRGEMEEKIDEIIKSSENNKVILFIDEMHSIITAGNSDNGLSIGEILKSAINNSLTIIGTTTFSYYSKFIEKDPAFERRFSKIIIEEPSCETAYKMIKGIKNQFEKHYDISITDEVINAAVKLSKRYLTNRFLPDKAIDLIDEACSKNSLSMKKKYIDTDDVSDVLSEITGIPVKNETNDNLKILSLRDNLKKRIIGQDEGINAIYETIIRSRSGLREGKRPIGSFIFLGTTGIGKTETAKVLAETLFGSEEALIRFDMSEYIDKNSVNKLIGAPPGYVGYEEGGTLTEAVKNKPCSVILFDEIEKADTEIFNVLLQVLDDGRLTDGKGKTIDFKNTLIIMTSNVGTDMITKNNSVGFIESNKELNEKYIQIKALKNTLKPEFINRIDNIIVFKKLNKENIAKIANIILRRKKEILFEEKGIIINFTDDVALFIAEKAYDENYGARPVRRAIENLLENKLSELILSRDLKDTEINVSVKNGEILISD